MLLNVAEAGPPNFAHFARRVSLLYVVSSGFQEEHMRGENVMFMRLCSVASRVCYEACET